MKTFYRDDEGQLWTEHEDGTETPTNDDDTPDAEAYVDDETDDAGRRLVAALQ